MMNEDMENQDIENIDKEGDTSEDVALEDVVSEDGVSTGDNSKDETSSRETSEDGTSSGEKSEDGTSTGETSEEGMSDDKKSEDEEHESTNDSKDKHDKKDKKDLMIEELTDKYKRTFAEFDNFRKRSEKEKSQMFAMGAKSVVEKILPVLDNFERGFATVSEEDKNSPFVEGMDKIYRDFIRTLEDMGVEEIEAEGKEFDPNLHNAVMHVEDENLGENVVAEVMQKGYKYKDSVIRHSMVKVAN